MNYLKKSFNNIKNDNNKILVIDEIISNLTKLKNKINENLNGNEFIQYFKDINEEKLEELKDELYEYEENDNNNLKDKYLKTKKEINKLEEIKKILNNILNIKTEKEEYFDDNEGWKTTKKKLLVIIELENNYKLKFTYSHQYHGYDRSENYYRNFYIYKNDKKLLLNKDYYEENEIYYNGEKIKKNNNSISNFQSKLNNYCMEKDMNFDKLNENELLNIANEIKKESIELKKKIDEQDKIKNTSWSILLNTILKKFSDKDEYEKFFDNLD